MRKTDYKNSKTFNSHRFHCLLSIESYKNLTKKAQKEGKTMTEVIENFLSSHKEKDIQKKSNEIKNILNFNKKFYTDLNATMSNINQIALRLNIANLSDDEWELENLTRDENFLMEIKHELNELKQGLEETRKLTNHFANILLSKTHTRKR